MKVHLIGLGGIGVSALAQYYLNQGWHVSGSDLQASEITAMLQNKGAVVSIGPARASNVPNDVKLVVYSPAVTADNSELQRAKQLQVTSPELKVQSYPQALGQITRQYFTIAVCGTHGKSTTTAMIAKILIAAGFNPTVIIGTKLKEFDNSNFRSGGKPETHKLKLTTNNQQFLIIEADEWNASFLNYWPELIVLTSIELEHLDYFKDLKHILKTYQEFISHLPNDGILITNDDDPNVKKIKATKTIHYSLKQPEAAKLKSILKVPGIHNVANSLAALWAARALGVENEISFDALSEYEGAWRRMETSQVILGSKRITLISDYGHHPTEVKATMLAVREKYPKNKVWLIFQPHQYQRTYYSFDDFVKLFQEPIADYTTITDIYEVAGRESELKEKVSAQSLVAAIKRDWVSYEPFALQAFSESIKATAENKQVVVIMGAGNIDNLYRQLIVKGR